MDIGEGHYLLILKCEIWDCRHFVYGWGELKTRHWGEEKGMVLVLAMLLLLVVTLIGISALSTSTYDIRISGNERASVQAFYVAEAGINELMGRFRTDATHQVSDSDPSNPAWKLLLAKDPGKGATQIGYVSGDPHSIPSLQNQLDFGVEIKHKTDEANQVIHYGGVPVYIVKSYGFTADGGNKVLEVELIKSPSYDPPSALYSRMPVQIHGSSSYINGNDACGTTNKPGITTTTTTTPPITESGNPSINGSPPKVTQANTPPPKNLPLKEMVDYLKSNANFRYSYNENQTLTGYSDGWGTPISNDTTVPITYTGSMNIVYFNLHETQTLKLAGDSHGAGILLVEGNLEIHGGFTWYGVILATGAVEYTGGGRKNVTGGIIAGENAATEIHIDENAGIVYCSAVSNRLKEIIPPLKITRWREIF
jgi:Na+-transporting methylmalonyl-CoA/oxaloacetate decarboxylase gamma subunit